jgi:thymidine kinase
VTEQLKSLGNKEQRTGNGFDELDILIRRCCDELQMFERMIVHLQHKQSDRSWKKLRKGLKAVFKREEFECMKEKMTHYVSFFTVHLGIVAT